MAIISIRYSRLLFLAMQYWDWISWSTSLVASIVRPSVSQGFSVGDPVVLFDIYRRRACSGTGYCGALHWSLPQERCSTAWPPAAHDRVIHIEIFNHVTARCYTVHIDHSPYWEYRSDWRGEFLVYNPKRCVLFLLLPPPPSFSYFPR